MRSDPESKTCPEFNTYYRAAEALNVVGLVLLSFLLITFIVLPVEKTRGHYLSYCLIIAGMFMAVSRLSKRCCTVLISNSWDS